MRTSFYLRGYSHSGLYGEAPPVRGAFFKLAVLKGRENSHFSI